MLQARGFSGLVLSGLVLLSRPLSEEATPNIRKPSSVQGHLDFSEHLDNPWGLDRSVVECRFSSLGWRVASYDHDVEVVRIFTIHTSFDTAGVSRQGLPSQKAHIWRERFQGVQMILPECVPLNLALPCQHGSGSSVGPLCRGKKLKVPKRPNSGLGLVFSGEVAREQKDSHRC